MKKENKELNELKKIAYIFSVYKVGSHDVAEDISSGVISLYLLKQNEIESKNAEGWIINTAKHFCSRYFEQQKTIQKIYDKYIHNHRNELHSIVQTETNEKLREAYNKALDTLTDKQFSTLNLYYQCEQNYKRMSLITEISESALRQRISRVKKKLRAETFISLGVIATRKIVTPELNDLLYQFFRRLKKNIENNSMSKMFYYFSETDIRNYTEQIHIKKIVKYEIVLNDTIYTVDVYFRNPQNEPQGFNFQFRMNGKHLKIVSAPILTSKSSFIKAGSESAKQILELFKKYPDDEFGKSTVPKELLMAIVRKHKSQSG